SSIQTTKTFSISAIRLCLHSVQLAQAVKRTQSETPALGRAGRATVLRHPLHTDTYTGLLAFWGDQHKLGYLIAHGNLGF
uniref:Uncharacterized protein n=1 Tax=Apteryx owenii TaxID=8824 RepID=A0A8B9SFF0_APTOW